MRYRAMVLLELEAGSKLNLTLTEERAIRTGRSAERRIKCQSRSRQVIERGINSGHLSSIEPVEALSKHFHLHPFRQTKAAGKPGIEIPDVRLLEEVTREKGKTS